MATGNTGFFNLVVIVVIVDRTDLKARKDYTWKKITLNPSTSQQLLNSGKTFHSITYDLL